MTVTAIIISGVARPHQGHVSMAAVLVSLGFFMISPVILVLINSFNAAADWFVEPRRWRLDHWHAAYQNPRELLKHGRDRPLPFIDQAPFNIFSVAGIVRANLMANGVFQQIEIEFVLGTPIDFFYIRQKSFR